MKNSKGRGLLRLALLLVLVALAGFFGYGYMDDIKLGLDLAGGVSITYQAKDENPSAEDMKDTIYKLQQRVQNYSTEAEVYQEGNDRINIDIPGVSDANAILAELGKPGSLVFMDSEGTTILTGDQVSAAQAGMIDGTTGKEYVVSLTFTEEGTKAFADATTNNVGQPIYIIYDNEVVSAPIVQEAITGGQCTIDGIGSFEEAENLASTIRIGSLSLELEELRSNVVGAKLGQQAITTSLKAGVVGFAIVAVFMIAVYLIPGLASVIALCLYVGLILILLVSFNVTLTLPGVAGIILSIGMAVDANVIIFTRIKEEIGAGKAVKTAIQNGFQKALSAIVDGNVTTLIAAAVLFWRGSGTVKGFASTLAIGIILSMFTALFVTRFALNALFEMGIQNPKFYGIKREKPAKPFLKYRKLCFALSSAVIVAGFVFMGLNKSATGDLFNYSMEFQGGTSTNVTFNENLSQERIESEVVPLVEDITGDADVQTQKVTGTNEVIIKTRTLNMEEREEFEKVMQDNFGVEEGKITAESISGAVSQEMKQDAIVAVVIATVCMLIYIWFRFKNIRFAASSVLALVHDVLVVIACYAAFKWPVGSTFIACILTIVGYSINATIVIFDRVRENLKERKHDQSMEEILNQSITQTFTRSVNTSLTTFVMVLILYIMGVSSIREFALPLMVGIVCGTYSSVCLAGSLWFEMNRRREKALAAAKEEARAREKEAKEKKKNKKKQ
ncbi:protein translocase subunit SecD [Clostridium sp. AM29-11AC]|uniref:protein translocase subunit SecD n=1 Tax=Clostridium sp. AM29-11AC TaxID=2293028 RepID=UPI000E4A3836|nr:protein translocase subunit SecD [Clostridium sp. AM29-11AC]RHT57081.1 protein translocase subunit SecD [Clostridium sp. AM29-11AC]